MVFENFAVTHSVRSINNLKRNDQKRFKKKSLNTFFISREEGPLNGRTLKKKDFAVSFS